MDSSRQYGVHGIVLKRRNIGESDRILSVLTKEYGKIQVIAKGVRRISSRRAPHIEIFTQVRLFLHRGKTWDSITDAQTINSFSLLRKSLSLVSAAYYLCEIVDQLLPERQEHPDIYEYLSSALRMLSGVAVRDIYVFCEEFSMEVLGRLGYISRQTIPESRQVQSFEQVTNRVEQIIEKRLRTPSFMKRLLH